jgi:hypothetical protein
MALGLVWGGVPKVPKQGLQQGSRNSLFLQQEVLTFAAANGDAAAAEKFGVKRGTIRSWRSRFKNTETGGLVMPDAEVTPDGQRRSAVDSRALSDVTAEELRRRAKRLLASGEKARRRLDEVFEQSKNPRDIAIALGIANQKAGEAFQMAMALEEREVRLAADQGPVISAIIRMAFDVAGVPLGAAMRRVVAELLLHADRVGDGVLVVSPADGEAARVEVLAHFEGLIGRRRAEDGSQMPLLPAGAVEEVTGEVEGDSDVNTVFTFESEPNDAEVIEEIPAEWPPGWLESYGPDREAAAEAFARYKAAREALRRQSEQRQVAWNVPGGLGSALSDLNRAPNF